MPGPATLETWTGDPALAWVICAAVLYLIGGRHLSRAGTVREQRWRTASFVAGLLTIVIALDSPIDELADKLLWVHMVQHILLLLVAPPLLVLLPVVGRGGQWDGGGLAPVGAPIREGPSGAARPPRCSPGRRRRGSSSTGSSSSGTCRASTT